MIVSAGAVYNNLLPYKTNDKKIVELQEVFSNLFLLYLLIYSSFI